jgi:hypothetical protein
MVGERVGLVSVTAAFKIEAMASEAEVEEEAEEEAAAKFSATDSAISSLSPISPVNR